MICFLVNLLLLPFRLLWDILVIACTMILAAAWLGFIIGSVVAVVLLLIFMPRGFILPWALLALLVPLWRGCT